MSAVQAGVAALAVFAGGALGQGAGGSGPGGLARLRAEARFSPPGAFLPSPAVTYSLDLVPAGAWIQVEQRTAPFGREGTTVKLRVRGLVPGHAYGVHVHRAPCGSLPGDAGDHYRHRPAIVPDSANEVWLDFTPDAHGDGAAVAHHAWGFRRGEANSVVIHRDPGGKGDRLACFTVPFQSAR
ncbi:MULTISPECIES: superoxide dismutase family protein [unclassified Streptomyces]|uniref:superoxide dismutase family protein n=1 Tax=unclassified Streptomyces TaxID=2593676 RepID=UPI00381B396C